MTARKPARCPNCNGPAGPGPGNAWRPFCSERCKLSDLGQWFAGRYAIPAGEDSEAATDLSKDPQARQ